MRSILLMCVMIKTVGVLSKDLSESERSARASFIQRLLNKQKYLEGRIKLIGGPTKFEGNVYIYHAGRWGAVCDDSWDNAAAQVVCRNFNKTGIATHGGQYGEAKRKYWMDDVVCEGDEQSLSHCIFSGWGSSDCEASEVAGVICGIENEPQSFIKKKRPSKMIHEVLDIKSASLRLTGGRNNREGRVEIYYNGAWGSICPDGWTLYEALAVCHHLALGYAEQAVQSDYFGNSTIVLSGVQCQGNESNLFMCKHQEYGAVVCPGEVGHVAGVICTNHLADLALDVVAIERTAHLQDVPMYQLQCAMEENCLSKTAYEIKKTNPDWQFETRRLLRFTASSLNIGNEEFRPYLPKHLWQWHLCHMHYHSMEVFATFDVLDATGRRIAEGHKASFCLEDNTCMPGVERKFSCKNYGDQGVSVNCSDIYQYNIDCQWVDVTDIQPGEYTFKVAVNPHARVAEQQYHNNAASCSLRLTDSYASVYGCILQRP
ncbi:lysyl oxidase homolog 2B [Galleria mellonella]|uniref:protein-lysine 6-oxidase n=1 Tax=Galleria mellonella TaxID=7137 RepID=A0A6J3BX48_GALME|nr:lysyl oxidase homolog 2B [Galleria mellonella]XP_031764225.2 lysyl oxidase homolog 2B [Galleria mellonella]XP_052751299.1 lysyl oxidase homolog 2B [Galleria mellonella]